MVSLTNYPMCCGAHVIQNFSGDSEASRNLLIELVAKFDKGEGVSYASSNKNRMLLVILNDTQCNNNPRTLQTLADLGFAYVARQNNGVHDSWINLFVRTKIGQKDVKAKYQKPKFKYPGLSLEGWSVDADKLTFPLKKVPKNKSGIVDPFKKRDPYNPEPDYTYVIDRPALAGEIESKVVEVCDPFAAMKAA